MALSSIFFQLKSFTCIVSANKPCKFSPSIDMKVRDLYQNRVVGLAHELFVWFLKGIKMSTISAFELLVTLTASAGHKGIIGMVLQFLLQQFYWYKRRGFFTRWTATSGSKSFWSFLMGKKAESKQYQYPLDNRKLSIPSPSLDVLMSESSLVPFWDSRYVAGTQPCSSAVLTNHQPTKRSKESCSFNIKRNKNSRMLQKR